MMEIYYAIIFLKFKKVGGKMKAILKVGVGVGILTGIQASFYFTGCRELSEF